MQSEEIDVIEAELMLDAPNYRKCTVSARRVSFSQGEAIVMIYVDGPTPYHTELNAVIDAATNS